MTMDPLLEDSIPHRRAVDLARGLRKRQPTRFERWALTEVSVFRFGIFLFYLGCIYFGSAAFIAGIPTIEKLSPPWFQFAWPISVTVGGALAMFGSVGPPRSTLFQWLGRVGSFFVWVGLLGYSGMLHYLAYLPGQPDAGRVAAAAGFATMGMIPLVHFCWLMARIGMRPLAPDTGPVAIVLPVDPDDGEVVP